MRPDVCKVGPVPPGQWRMGLGAVVAQGLCWSRAVTQFHTVCLGLASFNAASDDECHLARACEGNGLAFHTDRIRGLLIHSGCALAC